MDKSSTPQKNVVKMERAEAVETKEVNFLSFNCKNIKTIGPFLHHHHNKIDILLLQEHWLFDHELSLLNEVSQKYCGTGKAVNTGDEDFIFTRCHRGYGGVAILWSKCIDPLVKVFKEGNSRIQCIELKTNIPILCISTYLPTKVENDRYEEYSECIDQIFEIIQKYQNSHEIVIGGDFNEDISKNNNSRRASKLKELIADCELQINFHGPTFINAKGVEVSEIDYFLYKTTAQVLTEKIDDTCI